LRRHHERIAAQRRTFCHQVSTDLVRRHPLIAVEKLTLKGLCRGRFAKSFQDAAWGMFLGQLSAKVACTGRTLAQVDCRYTSQTCPECGQIKKKKLSERVHDCDCGCRLDRDIAAARVILLRAVRGNGRISGVEGPATTESFVATQQADPGKRLEHLAPRESSDSLPFCNEPFTQGQTSRP
jgi:putative transposase